MFIRPWGVPTTCTNTGEGGLVSSSSGNACDECVSYCETVDGSLVFSWSVGGQERKMLNNGDHIIISFSLQVDISFRRLWTRAYLLKTRGRVYSWETDTIIVFLRAPCAVILCARDKPLNNDLTFVRIYALHFCPCYSKCTEIRVHGYFDSETFHFHFSSAPVSVCEYVGFTFSCRANAIRLRAAVVGTLAQSNSTNYTFWILSLHHHLYVTISNVRFVTDLSHDEQRSIETSKIPYKSLYTHTHRYILSDVYNMQ